MVTSTAMATAGNNNNVLVSIEDGVVKLVFNGEEEDFVEYGADTTIESHTEINGVFNKNSKRPRGKNMRALLTCGGGTLVFESQEYTVSVEPRKKAGHRALVSSNVASLPKIDENTEQVLQNLKRRRMGDSGCVIEMYPNAEACKKMLDSNPIVMKVSQSDLDVITTRLTVESKSVTAFEKNAHVSFVVSDESQVPAGLLNFLTYFDLATHSWTGETEDEIHSFVETSITGPICKFFSPALRISRNKALKTSSGRADYSISSDYFQLFRGEDKMRSRMPKEDPMKELLQKSPKGKQWRMLYGNDVPYIFGYYSIGGTDNLLLQFVCIKENSSALIHLTDDPFDLTKFWGVFGCRCFMLAILPHLLSLKKKISAPIGLEWKITRTETRGMIWASWTVQIILDHTTGDCALAKDFYYDESLDKESAHIVSCWNETFAKLPISPYLMVLRRIDRRRPCPEEGSGRIRCVFAPLCRPASVSSFFDDELSARLALFHVLGAITALHDARLVHNDLRWANVVRKQGAHEYVLVDYDDMAMLDEHNAVPAITWMDRDTHAPDIDQRHDQKVDLWGLCKMMSEIACVHGDVSDIVEAGNKWLAQYPHLPATFSDDVTDLCSKNE